MHPSLYRLARTAPTDHLVVARDFLEVAALDQPALLGVVACLRCELEIRQDEQRRRGVWVAAQPQEQRGTPAPDGASEDQRSAADACRADAVDTPSPDGPRVGPPDIQSDSAAPEPAGQADPGMDAPDVQAELPTRGLALPVAEQPLGQRQATCQYPGCGQTWWYNHPWRTYPVPKNCPTCRPKVAAARLPHRNPQQVLQPDRPEVICRTCDQPFRRQGNNTSGKSCNPCIEAAKAPKPVPTQCVRCSAKLPQQDRPHGGRARQLCDACRTARHNEINRQRGKAGKTGGQTACPAGSLVCKVCGKAFERRHPRGKLPEKCDACAAGGPTTIVCSACGKKWTWDKPRSFAKPPANCSDCCSAKRGHRSALTGEIQPLVLQARAGDAQAWTELVQRFRTKLVQSARGFVAVVDVEAAVQDVLATAFETRLVNFVGGNLLAWLARCVRNRCIDAQRRQRETSLDALAVAPAQAAVSDDTARVDAIDEAARALAFAPITDDDREILVAMADGDTPTEIALETGLTPGGVSVRASRARKKVREARPDGAKIEKPAKAKPVQQAERKEPCLACGNPTASQPCSNCQQKGISKAAAAKGLSAADEPPFEWVEVVGDGTGGIEAGRRVRVKRYAAAGWAAQDAGQGGNTDYQSAGLDGLGGTKI